MNTYGSVVDVNTRFTSIITGTGVVDAFRVRWVVTVTFQRVWGGRKGENREGEGGRGREREERRREREGKKEREKARRGKVWQSDDLQPTPQAQTPYINTARL